MARLGQIGGDSIGHETLDRGLLACGAIGLGMSKWGSKRQAEQKHHYEKRFADIHSIIPQWEAPRVLAA